VRYFSRHFCELAASTWTKLGGEAFIFRRARPTPQLSYSVRWLKAHAGVVITASHNPPHDNGFKAYFGDGGQVVPAARHAASSPRSTRCPSANLAAFLDKESRGKVTVLGRAADDAYLVGRGEGGASIPSRLPGDAAAGRPITNIHGTGGVHGRRCSSTRAARPHEVREQMAFDPRFPTVKSPNPENAEALSHERSRWPSAEACDVVLGDRSGLRSHGLCGAQPSRVRMELLTRQSDPGRSWPTTAGGA
jgi:phosphoglucomutase